MHTKIGVVDTTFARADMGGFALDELRRNASVSAERATVPGLKDLPVASKKLIEEGHCSLVIACGMVGPKPVDKDSARIASQALQQVQLMTNTHILEVFVHEDEAEDERELAWLLEQRTREHARNAVLLLLRPQKLEALAGTGQRQGFADAGPARW
ncbi:MAG: riboflavin synthase [Euryarchaeota archaeon]|nr:riboflavin synthase [Euryarchaeota archaeon]